MGDGLDETGYEACADVTYEEEEYIGEDAADVDVVGVGVGACEDARQPGAEEAAGEDADDHASDGAYLHDHAFAEAVDY